MTIADRVALLFFAAVFSVAVGASIDGGLRSPYAATSCLALSECSSTLYCVSTSPGGLRSLLHCCNCLTLCLCRTMY